MGSLGSHDSHGSLGSPGSPGSLGSPGSPGSLGSLGSHTDYGSVGLDEAQIDPDPMVEFAAWLSAAERAGIYEPNAMVLSTVDPDGFPSSRTVLLKGLDGSGFEFVTNYSSRKGLALVQNPGVSLLFPWYALQRQVIVYGSASPTDPVASDAYFASRPRGSRIAAIASEQSRPIESREALERRVRDVEAQHPDDAPIDRPDGWGGFRVVPHAIEFWQGRTSRLHDRLRYSAVGEGAFGGAGDGSAVRDAGGGGWRLERLQP